MRYSRPGSIQSALQEAYRAVGGVENVATDIGVSQATISYSTAVDEDRPGGLGINHIDRLCRMHAEAAMPLARHFAALAGGAFQPVTEAACLQSAIAKAAKEGGESVSYSIGLGHDASEAELLLAEKEAVEHYEAAGEVLAAIRERLRGNVVVARKSA